MLNFLRIASQEGILIKHWRSLELLGQVDTVVFDKTGTLTCEVPTVGQIYAHLYTEDELWRLTAAAEYYYARIRTNRHIRLPRRS